VALVGHLGFVARSDWRYLLRHAQEAGERGLDGPGVPAQERGEVERTPDVGNYYMAATERGEPAGRWFGPGVDRVGRSGDLILFAEGDEVTAEAMERVYGNLCHPLTGESLGSRPRKYATAEERFAKAVAAEQAAVYGPLSEERLEELQFAARTKQREACHYYDLTFSPTKSWSVLYAGLRAAGLNVEADTLWECIEEGYKVGLSAAMEQSCYARVGRHSGQLAGRAAGRWEKSSEFVANLWRHHTSRSGDPQLHIHGALLNRVWIEPDPERNVKGGWYALDGTAVVKVRAEAAAIASRASEALAAERLGLSFGARPDGKGREIAGVDAALIEAFSTRRRKIEPHAQALADAYRVKYDREPTEYEMRRFHAEATVATRDRKPAHAPTGPELLEVWEAKARDGVGRELAGVPASAAVRLVEPGAPERVGEPGLSRLEPITPGLSQVSAGERLTPPSPAEWLNGVLPAAEQELVVEQALADVGGRLSVWTRADVAASLDAHLPASALAELAAADQQRLLDALTRTALAHPDTARLTAAPLHEAPESWRNPDGRGRYEAPAAYDRYTHTATLAREAHLVEAAAATGYPGIALDAVQAQLASTTLRPSQSAAVARVLSSGRAVDLVIGPAGTGKSYTIAEMARLWTEHVPGADGIAPRVLGLATSEAAVRVLREEGITRGLNVQSFLVTQERLALGQPANDRDRDLVTLRAGDLVILDEASMTSTGHMEEILAAAQTAGAKLVLAGDDRQLGAVEAGGVFSLLAERTRPVVLDEVVRFQNGWEGPASLRLRDGDVTAIREYDRRGRILGGTAEELREAARRGFVADYLTGRTSLVITPTNEAAAEVASHIRGELVALGRVEPGGVVLHNSTRAGVGDLVATRENDRTLDDGCGGWVANRDTWTVTARHDDGSLTVRRDLGADDTGHHHYGPEVGLPAAYVSRHVELAYASTVHAAQGRTVDTCYPIIDATMGTDALYVALTRARERTLIGVAIERDPIDALGPQNINQEHTTPEAVLAQIIERPREEPSATQVLASEVDARESLARLAPEWADLIRSDTQPRYEARLAELLGAEAWAKVAADPATPALLRAVRAADLAGRDVDQVLQRAVDRHELDTAASIAQVLHYRITLDTPTPAAGEDLGEAGSVSARTPELADPGLDAYAKAIAAAMDERLGVLGERAAAEPPAWAAALGPVPDDLLERAEWTRRAGVIAGYREQHGWHGADAIGPAPHRSAAEDRAGWHAAWTALGRPDEQRDVAAATRGELANTVQTWERTEALAPPNVDADLRGAYLSADFCDREARHCHLEAEAHTAAGRHPEAEQSGAHRDAYRRDEAAARVRAAELEEAATARQAWYESTTTQRRTAELARREATRRDDRELVRLLGADDRTPAEATERDELTPAVPGRDHEPAALAPALPVAPAPSYDLDDDLDYDLPRLDGPGIDL
jgi:conjugative relaxase-like TrwC/TraI family protein